MSHELITHNPDLKRLRDAGYEIEVHQGYLLIHNVPYVNSEKQVAYGILISTLELSEHVTVPPTQHTVLWNGDHPCSSDGIPLTYLINCTVNQTIKEGLVTTFSFSQKPTDFQGNMINYEDYYQKMTQYIKIVENHAHVIDSNVTAKTFVPILSDDDSVFCYVDTSSSRSGIISPNKKLKQNKVAIVGLGGTGSYVLDLIAKTPIKEIHLFDGDQFLTHNAFRSPGAPAFDELSEKPFKVERFLKIYSNMHKNLISHPYEIDDSNSVELNSMDMVFLCVDNGKARQKISKHLLTNKISFIDVGMCIYIKGDMLAGSARVSTCTPSVDNAKTRLSLGFPDDEDEYSTNIQIADINALNASLAVIRWKKMRGFYHDFGHEYNSVFQISTNDLANDEIYE